MLQCDSCTNARTEACARGSNIQRKITPIHQVTNSAVSNQRCMQDTTISNDKKFEAIKKRTITVKKAPTATLHSNVRREVICARVIRVRGAQSGCYARRRCAVRGGNDRDDDDDDDAE